MGFSKNQFFSRVKGLGVDATALFLKEALSKLVQRQNENAVM